MRFYESLLPPEGAIVAVRVDEINDYGVIVQLLEYPVQGMVMAGNVSRRRIRSVKEVVKIGQETAATVVKTDAASNTVDLSIKLCTPEEIATALDVYQKHRTIYKLLEKVAKKTSASIESLLADVVWMHIRESRDIYELFTSLNSPDGNSEFVLGTTCKHKDEIKEHIAEYLPTPSFTEQKTVRLYCSDHLAAPEKLTAALNSAVEKGAAVWVISPPEYRFVATAATRKEAIDILEASESAARAVLV
jgi:translation initiation factor 2 subunit 1